MKLPSLHWPSAVALLLLSIAFGLNGAAHELPTMEVRPPWPYLPYVMGGTTTWAAMLAPMTVVANVPDLRAAWLRALLLNLAGFVVFAAIAIGLRRVLCASVWWVLELPSYNGPWRNSLRELPHTSLLYMAIVAFYTGTSALAARKDARRRVADCRRQLSDSRTQVLRSRFDPEQVFASLARLRELMGRDLLRAEELIQELAAGLRASLALPPSATSSAFDEESSISPPSRRTWFSALPASAGPWRWPTLRWRSSAWTLALCLTVALLQATMTLQVSEDAPRALLTGYLGRALGVWCGLPIVQTFVLNAPNVWRHFVRCGLLFYTGQALFTLVYATGMIAARTLASEPALDWTREVWLSTTIGTTYAGLVALFAAARMRDEQRAEEQRAAELSALVAEARLEALSAQLEPHFLYNALNTVSSLMYRDALRTSQLIHNLSDLLRTVLEKPRPMWSLAEERAHTARFVSLVEARFGDRISVIWRLPARVDERLAVPRFALQLLVENSVKHNQHRRGALCISITGDTGVDTLRLAVDDDGDGFDRESLHGQEAGGGLRRLSQSLSLLYGPQARLARTNRDGGGAHVELLLPAGIAP